jgi:hypothetical protein
MKKVLIAVVLAVSAVGAQAHEFRGYQPRYDGYRGGDVAGAVIGGMILGAVIDRVIQPQVVYQQPPLVVSPGTVYQAPVYTPQYPSPNVCVQAYDQFGRYLGCMR